MHDAGHDILYRTGYGARHGIPPSALAAEEIPSEAVPHLSGPFTRLRPFHAPGRLPVTARQTPWTGRAAGRPRGPASDTTLRGPANTALAAGPASGVPSDHGRNATLATAATLAAEPETCCWYPRDHPSPWSRGAVQLPRPVTASRPLPAAATAGPAVLSATGEGGVRGCGLVPRRPTPATPLRHPSGRWFRPLSGTPSGNFAFRMHCSAMRG